MEDEGTRPATVARRLTADVIDGFLLAMLFVTVTYAVALGREALVTGSITAEVIPPSPSTRMVALNLLVNVVVSLAYWGLVEGRDGRSVGKRLVEIRVERVDGERISRLDTIVRKLPFYLPLLAAWVPGIGGWFVVAAGVAMLAGFVSYVLDDRHRGLHDRLGRTIVIET